jgi:hypothetical protein
MARPRSKRHLLVENAACLDIMSLLRGGWLVPGQRRTGIAPLAHHLRGTGAGAIHIASDWTVAEAPALSVTFALRDRRVCEQCITLTSLRRLPFGGERWFFRCPQSGARACRLFLPAGGERFLSREAHGLRYAAEHASVEDTDIERVARLYSRIAGEPAPHGVFSSLPPRPRGMHDWTYTRLAMKMMQVQSRVLSRLEASLPLRQGQRVSHYNEKPR